jgi:hypothetical protein
MHPVSTLIAASVLFVAGLVTSARGDLATACRADVQRLCPGVAPGGGRLARCIQEHAAQVSPACRQAIAERRERGGRGPGGGPGPGRTACRADVARLCPDAAGDREKLRACMRAHAADLSDDCKEAIAAWRQRRGTRRPAL